MILRRFLILITITFYLNFFGFINSEIIGIPGLFKIYDIAIVLVMFYLIVVISRKNNYSKIICNTEITKFINSFLLLTFIVFLSMPFRGANLFDSIKVLRLFFPLFIYYIILYDIIITGDSRLWEKLLIFISIWFSFVVILTAFFPFQFQDVFTANKFKFDQITNLARTYTRGFVFCYIGFIISFYNFQSGKKKYLLLLLFFGVAILLQGFRAYLITTLLITMAILFLFGKYNYKSKFLTMLIILFIGIFSYSFFEQKISTAVADLSDVSGTFGYRFATDLYLRLPLFLENKAFGIGFLAYGSDNANELGADAVNTYTAIYSTDSGYLNLLLMFGIVGSVFFIFILGKVLFTFYKYIKQNDHLNNIWLIVAPCTLILLIATQISHSGLTNSYGLLPLAIVFALFQGKYINHGKKN